jgi:AraC family transcriptional regulator
LPSGRRKLLGHGQINLWRGGSLWIGLAQSVTDVHAHHAIQLSIALKGAVRFRRPDSTRWTEYAAALIPPHVPHAFDAEGSVVANVFCEPESVTGRKLLERFGRSEIAAVAQPEADAAAARLHDRYAAGASDEALNATARSVLTTLAAAAETALATDPRVHKAIAAIELELSRSITLGEVAARVHLSPSRFRHLFVAETGVPFRAYVLWLRLQAALEHALAGATWTEAATRANFADSAHLTRTFKRMFGVVPASLDGMQAQLGRASLAGPRRERR